MDNDTHATIAIIGGIFVIGFALGMLFGVHECKTHPEKYGVETVQTQEVTE